MARTFAHINSSATQTTSSVTAQAPTRRGHCGARLKIACGCKLILHAEKRRSSTAEMQISVAIIRTNRLTSSASHSGRGKRSGKGISLRTASCRGKSGGAESHRPDSSALGASSPQRRIPARPGSDVQSVHPQLDQLLRSLLSHAVASYLTRMMLSGRWARRKFKRLRIGQGSRDWFVVRD